MIRRLWKLGGSLLDLPDVADRLMRVVDAQAAGQNLLLVGGGLTVDLVRSWSSQFALSDDESHDLALAGMALNSQLVEGLHERFALVDDPDLLASNFALAQVAIVNPAVVSALEARQEVRLPRTWSLTSDSIAAWLAGQLKCHELVLLKSVSVEGDVLPLEDVDPLFSGFLPSSIKLGWCNLRDHKEAVTWLAEGDDASQPIQPE